MRVTMKDKNGNIKDIFQKRRTDAPDKTFNYVDYILTFDFCDTMEKSVLYRCLKESWEWAHPPVKSEDDGEEDTDGKYENQEDEII